MRGQLAASTVSTTKSLAAEITRTPEIDVSSVCIVCMMTREGLRLPEILDFARVVSECNLQATVDDCT